MKLGLFGGTFDPPHIGHLIVAQDARAALGLDRIIFIPASQPPHKSGQAVSPADMRHQMLEAAIAGDPSFEVDPLELGRSGPSYTVDTLETLRAKHAGAELFLLLGADQFREFRTWREPERIAQLAQVVVLRRGEPEDPEADMEVFRAQWVNVTRIDISSTDIRRRASRGEPVRYLVPPPIEIMLKGHNPYKAR